MTCPICKRKTDPAYRPFCSRRCADVDLGRWLTGAYAIPTDEPPEDRPEPKDDPKH
jgi:endogenous inhibitor of DNA gyrase (YacG/DUF329 family)